MCNPPKVKLKALLEMFDYLELDVKQLVALTSSESEKAEDVLEGFKALRKRITDLQQYIN